MVETFQMEDLRAWLPWHIINRFPKRDLTDINVLVVHHSAVALPIGGKVREHIRSINAYHISHHGWPRIAYHYAIGPAGVVWWLNDHESICYHAGNWNVNTRSIGVCLLGDYRWDPPPQPALDRLRALRRHLRLPAIAHKEIVSTICPGQWWSARREWLNEDAAPGISGTCARCGRELHSDCPWCSPTGENG
jgi:N-acetylmuramoyl-L-alanine amidase